MRQNVPEGIMAGSFQGFCARVQGTPAVVQQVISAQLQQILGGKALPEYQAQFLQQHSRASLLHLAAAAEMGALLEPSRKEASAQLILSGARFACTRIPSYAHEVALPRQWLESILIRMCVTGLIWA